MDSYTLFTWLVTQHASYLMAITNCLRLNVLIEDLRSYERRWH